MTRSSLYSKTYEFHVFVKFRLMFFELLSKIIYLLLFPSHTDKGNEQNFSVQDQKAVDLKAPSKVSRMFES